MYLKEVDAERERENEKKKTDFFTEIGAKIKICQKKRRAFDNTRDELLLARHSQVHYKANISKQTGNILQLVKVKFSFLLIVISVVVAGANRGFPNTSRMDSRNQLTSLSIWSSSSPPSGAVISIRITPP